MKLTNNRIFLSKLFYESIIINIITWNCFARLYIRTRLPWHTQQNDMNRSIFKIKNARIKQMRREQQPCDVYLMSEREWTTRKTMTVPRLFCCCCYCCFYYIFCVVIQQWFRLFKDSPASYSRHRAVGLERTVNKHYFIHRWMALKSKRRFEPTFSLSFSQYLCMSSCVYACGFKFSVCLVLMCACMNTICSMYWIQ